MGSLLHANPPFLTLGGSQIDDPHRRQGPRRRCSHAGRCPCYGLFGGAAQTLVHVRLDNQGIWLSARL
uniref:Predicted protein n=1 Tax=Hordeum vulgare subsp. vulgare TaxID=112509 RepID=F2DA27_HORVV|nr:predicted protein [Hordeum vulgare subsp. vulgare]BAK06454.1 predicted protein [Hordeum vulgare subsp. vulgare]